MDRPTQQTFVPRHVLKRDLFGCIEQGEWRPSDGTERAAVRRSWTDARLACRPLAAWLARREARALLSLPRRDDLPCLLDVRRGSLVRSFIPGRPLDEAAPTDPLYFRQARALLRALHRSGITHDDLAKEQNWLVRPDGSPALVDFQLACIAPRRGRIFRLLAREDLRHLLKHKRRYCARALTARESRLLATPSPPARWIRRVLKPPYTLVTRRLLGWRDREGRGPSS